MTPVRTEDVTPDDALGRTSAPAGRGSRSLASTPFPIRNPRAMTRTRAVRLAGGRTGP
jgi:hypothetical protein